MKTTMTSEIPSHIGNEGICTITRKMNPIDSAQAEQDHELSTQLELVHDPRQ